VHVLEDYFLPEFKQKNSENKWKLYMARYVLKRAMSIRTSTTALKQKIELTLASKKANVEVLPRQYDLEALVTESKNEQKDNLFPQFLFTVLYIGELDHESTLFRAMDAARTILHAKSIGMVVVGDGVAKKEFQKRAELLGIKEQVLFLNDRSKINQYMRSANILICTDTSEASDDIVIKAAAIGLPILAAETPLRKDLFSDGVDAFLCQKEDTLTFSQKLVTFLNTNSLRIQFATAARYVVETSLNQDPASYKEAYKNSIESVFDPAD
jgi:glycosyltransferase involved in cell wall biosynthesis